MQPNRIKYLVYGGFITSRSDGRVHDISADKVAQLYRVPYDQCLFVHPKKQYQLKQYTQAWLNGLVKLAPRNDGDYNIENRKREQQK